MAENQDNNEIEYMTNKEDISYPQDIDVIFNDDDDDNVKLIIPDYNDMKDFENNSQDDFISDDDLDFVDSVAASSHDLDVVFEDDEPIEVDDNPVLEIREEEPQKEETPSILNLDEKENQEAEEPLTFGEPENDTEPLVQTEESTVNSEVPENLSEETEEEEIINLDEEEEPSELQDVIVIEQETKNEDIEIISPALPQEEIIPPEVEPDEVISLEEPEDVVLTEETKEEQKEDIVVLEESTEEEEPISEPAFVEEPALVEEETQDFVIDTKVETELVDSALNELNNSSDFEIIEESETNDIPLKLEEETLKEEETHNFTISSEPEVVAAETSSDDDIIKSVLALQDDEEEIVKTEEEEILEENVFAVSNIDETRGFYFAKNEQTFALFGYINDEIFLLKDFQELYDKNLGIRLEERKFYSESYLVKVNSQKFLVEVDETSMKLVMEF